MNSLHFSDYDELVYKISEIFEKISEIFEFGDIAIIAKYHEARNIVQNLIEIGYDIHSIEITPPDTCGYADEYMITLLDVDGHGEIYCETFKKENGYLIDNSDVIFIMDNCSSKVLSHLDSKAMYEVTIDEDCESDDRWDCSECDDCYDCPDCPNPDCPECMDKISNLDDSKDKVRKEEETPVKKDTDTDKKKTDSVEIKLNVDDSDVQSVKKVLEEMESQMKRIDEIFGEMELFRNLFCW